MKFTKIISLLLCLSLFILVLPGCDKESSTGPTPVNEFELVEALGNAYFTSYTTRAGKAVNIGIADVFTLLTDNDATNDPFIVDYRSATDFATGHLKGATNVLLKDLVAKVDDGTIPKTKLILNVCYTGQTSSHATSVLNLLGYEAQNLSFGMCGVTTSPTINGTDKWSKQIEADEYAAQLVNTKETFSKEYAFPTLSSGKTTGEEIVKARFQEYLTRLPSMAMISATDVFTDPSKYFIINYWLESQYLNPGHIPGAYQMTPKQSLKKEAQLKYLPTDKKIVVYCHSGQTSSQLVAYLQVLGYEAYSLSFGVNGFAYHALDTIGSQYKAPTNDYSSIIVK